jgi:predicted amidohydrolase
VFFKRGQRASVFNTEFGKIGIQICGDIFHPEIAMTQSLAGAWLIVHPSAVPIIITGGGKYPSYYEGRAYETATCWCYVNLTGDQGGVKFHGGTAVYLGSKGLQVQASMGEQSKEEVITYEIDKEDIYSLRRKAFYLRDVRPELIEQLLWTAKNVQHGS